MDQKESRLNIINDTGQDHVVSFYLIAGTGHRVPTKFEVILPNGGAANFELDYEYRELQMEILVHPGVNKLKVCVRAEQVNSGADSRECFLKFQIVG